MDKPQPSIPGHGDPVVIGERVAEVGSLISRVRYWSARRFDVVAVGLAGSWSHGDVRMDSDVDILLLTTEKHLYLEDESWVGELGGLRLVKTKQWGPLAERRFVLPSGLEVEMGIATLSWAATETVDHGTRKVVEDGISIVYDPTGILARLLDACR